MLNHLKKLTVLAAALALAACARQPLLPDAAQLLNPGKVGLTAGKPAAVEASWWREFKDPQLDALIAQALVASPSLLQARARIMRAAAAEEAAGAAAQRSGVAVVLDQQGHGASAVSAGSASSVTDRQSGSSGSSWLSRSTKSTGRKGWRWW